MNQIYAAIRSQFTNEQDARNSFDIPAEEVPMFRGFWFINSPYGSNPCYVFADESVDLAAEGWTEVTEQ